MRVRPLAVFSLAAVSALLLAGCAGSASPDATPTSGDAGAGDLCSAQVASGAAIDALVVEGPFGSTPEVVFAAPLEIADLEARTIIEGSGDSVQTGDLVQYALSAYNAETGDLIATLGYEDGDLLPAQIAPENPLGQVLGCAAPGARAVAAFPATDTAAGEVYVLDLIDVVPVAAWGKEQAAVDGMPAVTLDDTGAPTVEIPNGDAPTEVEIAVLKKGDGPTVETGDGVLVQYSGVLWSDGSVFDSSWQRGVPSSFQTTSVVDGFQQALEGQQVGSQVLVVIPPEFGYGDVEQGSIPAGSTLVFVIDILGTQHPAR